MSMHNNSLILLYSEHRPRILEHTNYANAIYDLLPYSMASATLTIESNSS